MKYAYDLHLHSALSPCGDMDMTPNNIVNMALLKGLDLIALSDHNHIGNLAPVMEIGRKNGLCVIPGMEIETAEEIHILALFPDLLGAQACFESVYQHLPEVKNRAEIFGRQVLLNEMDEEIGEEPKLLVTATDLSIQKVKDLVEASCGVAVPAHIDRTSYSVLSNLGLMPDIGFTTVEVSKNTGTAPYEYLKKNIIQNSDAHYLEDISEAEHFIDLEEKSAACLIACLKRTTEC